MKPVAESVAIAKGAKYRHTAAVLPRTNNFRFKEIYVAIYTTYVFLLNIFSISGHAEYQFAATILSKVNTFRFEQICVDIDSKSKSSKTRAKS